MKMRKRLHSGSALISAIFITAVAAMMATALSLQTRLLINEGNLALHADQVYLDLQSQQDAAQSAILSYVSQFANTQNPSQQVAPLQTTLPPIKVDNMQITTTIDSELGKFNLNDLVYVGNQVRFVSLVHALLPDVPQSQSIAIAQSITAWMMTGADDRYYLSLNPPYRSSQNEFTDISELKLIKGVTPQIYNTLKPYITALPMQKPMQGMPSQISNITQADINALLAPVLTTLLPNLTIAQATAIVNCRVGAGAFATVAAFTTICGKQAGITSIPNAGTNANFF